jgi:hypothetical protein
MVRVRVRRQDRAHSSAGRFEDPLDMDRVMRPRVDHRQPLCADQIRIRPGTGHESGIARDQPPYAWRDFVQLAGCERHAVSSTKRRA